MEKPSEETLMLIISAILIFIILMLVLTILSGGGGPEGAFSILQNIFALISVYLLSGIKTILHG